MIKDFLFPKKLDYKGASAMLLALRLLFGIMLITHGVQKIMAYDALAAGNFPDPLGIGSAASVGLAIFGEVVCSAAFVFGFLYRLSMLPMIITLAVAFFAVHGGSVAEGELAFIYLVVFIIMYAAGPGSYSLDALISRKLGIRR